MTRTISLITATVGAALLFVVPAYGDNWGADKAQPPTQLDPMVEDGFAQAVAAAEQIRIERMLDARERGLGATSTQTTPVDARSDGLNRLYGLGEYANPIDRRERALVEKSQTKVESTVGFDARSDGLNRIHGLGEYANPIDRRERALVEKSQTNVESAVGFDARSDGLNRIHGLGEYAPPVVADDRFRIDHSNVPDTVSVSSSGRDVEWPEIGIGFAVALMLLLGLGLTLKATHTRPFAH